MTGHEGPWGMWMQGSTYAQPRHWDEVGWLVLRSAAFTPGEIPRYPFYRRLSGPQGQIVLPPRNLTRWWLGLKCLYRERLYPESIYYRKRQSHCHAMTTVICWGAVQSCWVNVILNLSLRFLYKHFKPSDNLLYVFIPIYWWKRRSRDSSN